MQYLEVPWHIGIERGEMEENNKSFLFSFFLPSLFMIFLSSYISQYVVFKKQGLINEVSVTEDVMRILAFIICSIQISFGMFSIPYFLFTISVILMIVNTLLE